jgi:CheY-like chemotaxis protein
MRALRLIKKHAATGKPSSGKAKTGSVSSIAGRYRGDANKVLAGFLSANEDGIVCLTIHSAITSPPHRQTRSEEARQQVAGWNGEPELAVKRKAQTPGDKSALAAVKRQTHSVQHILVVEDDTDVLQLYFDVLTRSGYQVDTAQDGEAGWRKLHAVRHDPDSYDLLITDNNLPKLSGVELIENVRSASMALPVILASGAVPINAERLRCDAILPKPFTMNQLVQTVDDVLRWSTATGNRHTQATASL